MLNIKNIIISNNMNSFDVIIFDIIDVPERRRNFDNFILFYHAVTARFFGYIILER